MKDISKLEYYLSKKIDKLTKSVIEAHEKSVDKIYDDVKKNAPDGYGDYKESIKRYPSEKTDKSISSTIGTDLKSDGYFLGRIIENGTGTYALEPHIGHTKTFIESGYRYWFVPKNIAMYKTDNMIELAGGKYYLAKPAPPKPHFRTTLEQDKQMYLNNIKNAIKEGLK